MQYRGSSDSRATADSHCETQGSRNEVKCHGNVSAEMSFNLGKRSCGEGLMSRWFGTRHVETSFARYNTNSSKWKELGVTNPVEKNSFSFFYSNTARAARAALGSSELPMSECSTVKRCEVLYE